MFNLLDENLEAVLELLLKKSDVSGNGYIEKAPILEMQELNRIGLLMSVELDYAQGATYVFSYQGKRYFENKRIAVESGELLDDGSLDLLKAIANVSSNGSGYSCDADNNEEVSCIRRFSQLGIVRCFYADNIPWNTAITDYGKRVLAARGLLVEERQEHSVTNNTVQFNGNVQNAYTQSGTTSSVQIIGVGDDELAALRKILELSSNEKLLAILGDKAEIVLSAAAEATDEAIEPSKRSKAAGIAKETLAQIGINLASSGIFTLLTNLTIGC